MNSNSDNSLTSNSRVPAVAGRVVVAFVVNIDGGCGGGTNRTDPPSVGGVGGLCQAGTDVVLAGS